MTAMVYDEARHVVLMYGGRDTAGGTVLCGEAGQSLCSADTWTWNGKDWLQLHPEKTPYPFVPTMTYDPSSGAPLLYSLSAETWSWNGIAWRLEAPESGRPTPHRSGPVMAFDPATGHVVMFGGFSHGGINVNTMWSWTGQSWTSLGAKAPFRRLQAAATANTDRHALLVHQNPQPIPPEAPAETWTWDGVQWTQLRPLHEPNASRAVLLADPKSHQVLLVGWSLRNEKAIEVWAWSGAYWKRVG
jgi:hypothetical protein